MRATATAADRLGAVVFASPDIDMDVFSSSIERIGPLARKITIITATNDLALAVSAQLAGGITRVGAAEKAALERLDCASSTPRSRAGASSITTCSCRTRGAAGDPPRRRRPRAERLTVGSPGSIAKGEALAAGVPRQDGRPRHLSRCGPQGPRRGAFARRALGDLPGAPVHGHEERRAHRYLFASRI